MQRKTNLVSENKEINKVKVMSVLQKHFHFYFIT